MKGRRAIVFFLSVLLALSGSPAGSPGSVKAANESNMRYYYGQLTGEAQKFYDAMYQMYVQGIFKTGTQDYDLISGGHLTQEQLGHMRAARRCCFHPWERQETPFMRTIRISFMWIFPIFPSE